MHNGRWRKIIYSGIKSGECDEVVEKTSEDITEWWKIRLAFKLFFIFLFEGVLDKIYGDLSQNFQQTRI